MAAERLQAGGPRRRPVEPGETVGDRTTWWAVPDGPGKLRLRPFAITQGRHLVAFAERPGVLGPFATKRQAREAGERATCTPDDSWIGLFAAMPAGVSVFARTDRGTCRDHLPHPLSGYSRSDADAGDEGSVNR